SSVRALQSSSPAHSGAPPAPASPPMAPLPPVASPPVPGGTGSSGLFTTEQAPSAQRSAPAPKTRVRIRMGPTLTRPLGGPVVVADPVTPGVEPERGRGSESEAGEEEHLERRHAHAGAGDEGG